MAKAGWCTTIWLLAALLSAFAWADEGACPPGTPRQDVVTLKNGQVFSGRIAEENQVRVVLERPSSSGGFARFTFKKENILRIRRGAGEPAVKGSITPIRDEWQLLRSDGANVGHRHLELWSVRSGNRPAFRLEESITWFGQGQRVPWTRTTRVELVDLKFAPLVLSYKEVTEAETTSEGPRRYERTVSGRVDGGVWRGRSFVSGKAAEREVVLPRGTRGPLGLREHLLRAARRTGINTAQVIDPDEEGLVEVRAGFAALEGARDKRGDEFHWEQDGRRRISWFKETRVAREEITEGVIAVPCTREQATAAEEAAKKDGEPDEKDIVKIPEAGIAFRVPDPLWTWKPALASARTGWRVLGRLSSKLHLADVRVEWHPESMDAIGTAVEAEAWLLRRLRSVSPDLQITAPRRRFGAMEGAWQLGLTANLKGTKVNTIAVVLDRPPGRVLLLVACPLTTWDDGRPALEKFLASIHLL